MPKLNEGFDEDGVRFRVTDSEEEGQVALQRRGILPLGEPSSKFTFGVKLDTGEVTIYLEQGCNHMAFTRKQAELFHAKLGEALSILESGGH